MRETPKGMPTKEEEARRANDWDAVQRASKAMAIRERVVRIMAGILAGLGTLLILAISFLIWVSFIAECVKLATRWGWLP